MSNAKENRVVIEITAKVQTTIILGEGETIEDLKLRDVDIYLHGAGEKGWQDKEDLGCYSSEIKIIEK